MEILAKFLHVSKAYHFAKGYLYYYCTTITAAAHDNSHFLHGVTVSCILECKSDQTPDDCAAYDCDFASYDVTRGKGRCYTKG